VSRDTISRRTLLAASGLVAVGGLSGCLDSVASAVTNTGASPAAAFAGERSEKFAVGEPHVSRLTPTLTGEARGLSGEVGLEGWVTSAPVVAANYNNTRSNRSTVASPDSALPDEELERILAYLDGEAIVAERFTVSLPDAEVPGGNGSIEAAVTPERLVDYVTGQSDGGGRVYSWGDPDSDGDGIGDCDDSDPSVEPGTVCGTTDHLVADVTGPTATGGRLEVVRASDGTVTVVNTPPEADSGPATVCAAASDDDPCGPGVWARTTGSGSTTGTAVSQVLVRPPECPHPFPALLYAQRCRSDDQLVFTGGWVIDEAALYAESMTVLSMATATPVVPVEFGGGDLDGDGFGDLVGRSVSGPRARRGARIDSGTVSALTESGVLSSGAAEGIRKRPGRRKYGDIVLKHVAVDAPVLHLVSAQRASRDVKFKAGAELSKAVN
jgi:hypothetical protein